MEWKVNYRKVARKILAFNWRPSVSMDHELDMLSTDIASGIGILIPWHKSQIMKSIDSEQYKMLKTLSCKRTVEGTPYLS